MALKTAWYALIANTDISEDDCTETGHLWLEAQKGTFHCFHWTVSQDSRQCKDDDPTTVSLFPNSTVRRDVPSNQEIV